MAKTPIEKIRDAKKAVAVLDLERAKAVEEIMSRPGIAEAVADLTAIYDPDAAPASVGTDINALIKTALTALTNIAPTAAHHVEALEAVINGPTTATAPAMTPATPPVA